LDLARPVVSSDFVEKCKRRFLDLFSQASSAKTFGAYSRIFVSGTHRPIDTLISKELNDSVLPYDEGESTFKVLEVGAGTTYGTNSNFGSPWLARSLRSTLSLDAEIIVSDQRHQGSLSHNRIERHILFYLDTEGTLHSLPFDVILKAGENAPISQLNRATNETYILDAIPINELRNISGHHLSEPSSTIDFMFRNYGAGGRFFVRPELDGEMEFLLFGTTCAFNVDYYNLTHSFPNYSFDFLFARHLAPLPNNGHESFEKILNISDSVAKVLKPHGKGYIHFDHPSDGEGDLVKITSLTFSRQHSNTEYSLLWSRHGVTMHCEERSLTRSGLINT
jgi:hypothetical protein